MVSRENTVIVACITLATALFVAFQSPAVDPADWQIIAVLIGVGVILPTIINSYLGSHEAN